MTWEQIRAEIAQAIGTQPDSVPRPSSPEFPKILGSLLDTHPELAAKVQAWLIQAAEPVGSQSEILKEARKAEARRTLGALFTKRDPTQPHRRRSNKPVIYGAIFTAILLLYVVGRMHSPPPTAPTPTHARPPAAARQAAPPSPGPSLPTPSQPPQAAQPAPAGPRPGTTSAAPPAAQAPLPSPPLPSVPPAQSQAPAPTQQEASGGPSVVASPAQQSSQGPSVQVVVGAGPETAQASVVAPASAASQGGGAGGGATIVTASQPQAAQAGQPGQAPQGASAQQSSTAQAGQGAPSLPHFQIGDQFTVTLATPLAVSPSWQALPAVATAIDGPLAGWQVVGTASQGQDGSLQISWTQAISPDRKTTLTLHGVAYDPSLGKPGVPGATSSVMAPQAARTALAGALSAVSQYVQDQIQAQQTQVFGLTATITSQVPPFWQVLAQQLASGFQPAPVQGGGTVLVTRVAAGTKVVVFITAPSP